MKMVELQPGLGVGAENYHLVFIFENPDAFNTFVTSGWELGTNAMASAKDERAEPVPPALCPLVMVSNCISSAIRAPSLV